MSDRHYDSDEGEFVDFETLADWEARDKAKDARIRELEAALQSLRQQITEASDPDFLFGAMDNVNDMDVGLTQFAEAASRAIRASLRPDTEGQTDEREAVLDQLVADAQEQDMGYAMKGQTDE